MDLVSVATALLTPLVLIAATAIARHIGYRIPYRIVVPLALLIASAIAVASGVVGQNAGLRLVIVLGFATAIGGVHYLDSPGGSWGAVLRGRLLMGIPWGTLVSIVFVLGVYLFLQGGLEHPYSPLSVAFTSWSYFYPLGVVTAPFSHASLGHVTGNLIGTVVLAPIAEYAWGHFPTRRGDSSFASWRSHPYVRAFVLFPLGVLLVGLATSVFAWGAIIGFSGVVFAFAGFAVVRYPLFTVIALSARGAINATYYALRNPVVVETANPSFGPPWWVGIAVQGHLLGLLLGALVGLVLVGRRRDLPSAGRLFAGIVLLGFGLTLYAVWWYRGPTTFVLYRGFGVLLVLTLALVLTVAMRAGATEVFEGVTRRQFAIMFAILPLLTMALVAVPINTMTFDNVEPPDDAIQIEDYRVYYAEDVSNERVGAVDIELFNETTSVQASGVIVYSKDRHVWTEAESTGALAFWGDLPIRVGGVGWRRTVVAKRTGWRITGDAPVYHVFLKPPDGDHTHVFASENRTAGPTIEYRNVTFVPRNRTFELHVTRDNSTLGQATIPDEGNSTRAGGLTFRRENSTLYAVRNGTRVQIATKEQYE